MLLPGDQLDNNIENIYFLYMTHFEWDSEKSQQNKRKHGVSFDKAIEIWQGPVLEASSVAYAKNGESRSATLGMIEGQIFCVIWTKRNKKIRIISARRARDEEKQAFFKAIQNI